MNRSEQSVMAFLEAAAQAFKAFPSECENGNKKMGDTVDHLLINDSPDTGHLISRTSIDASFQLHYSPNGDILFNSNRPRHLDFIVRAETAALQGVDEVPRFVTELIYQAILTFAPHSDYAKSERKRRFEQMFGSNWSDHAPENAPVPFAIPA